MINKPFPDKKYQIIYADPPWDYCFGKTSNRRVSNHYDVMDYKDIAKIPVNTIADDNSVLLIWSTFPKLNEVFTVIESWGFVYKTGLFTWIKKNKKSDSLFWGMGNYTRSNAEICLLAVKGKLLPRFSHGVHSVIFSHIEKHSKKPDEARKRIIELFGNSVSRIELFARQKVEGWDCWGNEIVEGG